MLEGLMLMLKLQNFGQLMQNSDSLEKPCWLGKIESRRKNKTDDRGRDGGIVSLTQWI